MHPRSYCSGRTIEILELERELNFSIILIYSQAFHGNLNRGSLMNDMPVFSQHQEQLTSFAPCELMHCTTKFLVKKARLD